MEDQICLFTDGISGVIDLGTSLERIESVMNVRLFLGKFWI